MLAGVGRKVLRVANDVAAVTQQRHGLRMQHPPETKALHLTCWTDSRTPAVGSSGGSGGTENGDDDTFSCFVARSPVDSGGVSSSRPRFSDGPAGPPSPPAAYAGMQTHAHGFGPSQPQQQQQQASRMFVWPPDNLPANRCTADTSSTGSRGLLLRRTAGLAPDALRRRFSHAMTRPARSSARRFCSRLLVCGSPSRCSWFTICRRQARISASML